MRKTQMPTRAAALSASILSLTVSAIFASSGAAAATVDSAADIPGEIRFAMQRDLGMMPGQIPQYLSAEKRSLEIERNAKRIFGNRYAGTWLERDARGDYQSIVAVNNPHDAAKVRALGGQVRVVKHSLSELEATRAQLDNAARTLSVIGRTGTLDPRIHSWSVDPVNNRVVVTTDPGAADAAVELVAASHADIRMTHFTESQHRPRLSQAAGFYGSIFGGQQLNIFDRSGRQEVCSVGFAVTLGTNQGYLTAGHCGVEGATVLHPATGPVSGTIFRSVYPGSDFAIVHHTSSYAVPVASVLTYQYGGQPLPVRGDTAAALYASICSSGITSGARCGTLIRTGVTVNFSGNLVYGLSEMNTCSAPGDSGGSVITPAGQAQGVLAASTNVCGSSSPVGTFFQPLQPILASTPGLTLKTTP